MDDNKQSTIIELKTKISNLEHELEAAKRALFELGEEDNVTTSISVAGRVIEGTFNGENMEGPDGKTFPVPANYASKSKLVEGDRLKLTIGDDGTFLFKQIGPAERRKAIGELKFENNAYYVETGDKSYHVLYASVTYYKAKPGDKVSIVLSGVVSEPKWCALEGIIHNISEADRTVAEGIAEEQLAEEMKAPVTTEAAIPVAPSLGVPGAPETPETVEVTNNLNIDELEIVGARGDITPQAVNPQEYAAPTVTQAPLVSPDTIDSRMDAIQELEI